MSTVLHAKISLLCLENGPMVFFHKLTKLDSVAKPSVMVAPPLVVVGLHAELRWQHAKIWLPWQQGSIRIVFNDRHHYIAALPDP